jgi:hypothetical protein
MLLPCGETPIFGATHTFFSAIYATCPISQKRDKTGDFDIAPHQKAHQIAAASRKVMQQSAFWLRRHSFI